MSYTIIMADPPWQYDDKCHAGKRGVDYKYDTMTPAAICALPVPMIAADDSALFLWVTAPMMPVGLQVIDAWGFTYKTIAFVWVKRGYTGKLAWGMGNWTRANAEFCLFGIRGRPKRVGKGVHQIIESPRRKHSQKPEVTRNKIVQLMGDVPRIELFSRDRRTGWDCWGNEVDGIDPFTEATT